MMRCTGDIFRGSVWRERGGWDGGRLDYFMEFWTPPSNIHCDHYICWGGGEREWV